MRGLVGRALLAGLRHRMERGRRALFRAFVVMVLAGAGLVLMLASALMALSAWIGPVAAAGAAGIVLLCGAALAGLILRDPPPAREGSPRAAGPVPGSPQSEMAMAGMLAGFVLGRALRRRLAGSRRG